MSYNSKYTGKQVEELLDLVKNNGIFVELTEATATKPSKNVFIAKENNSYTITEITSWTNWIVDASGFISLVASLGRSTDIQLNIVYLKSATVTVNNILSYEKVPETGTVEYNIRAIPDGCTHIFIANRTNTLSTPTFTLRKCVKI